MEPAVPIGRIPRGDIKPYFEASPRIIRALMNLPKPVIAMINGHAHGAGFEICLACDFRTASEEATFAQAQVLRGIVPGTVLLPRYVGVGKATEMLMTGERSDAKEAERIGIVNRVVAKEQLEATVKEFANRLAKGPTKAIGLLKIAQNRGLDVDVDKAFEYQAYAQMLGMQTEDAREAISAFLEKREPRFKGK
jgi:2-(1,2-epoxy-1,2-dihydrophenyl)acetyl-CoA isomerase